MRATTRVNMDTQNTCFMAVASQETLQTKTIEVIVATTSPFMRDRELPSSTYRYVTYVHACKASCTKHVIEQ